MARSWKDGRQGGGHRPKYVEKDMKWFLSRRPGWGDSDETNGKERTAIRAVLRRWLQKGGGDYGGISAPLHRPPPPVAPCRIPAG